MGLSIESPDGVKVRIGLTDYLQQHSGDVAFANVKPVGTALNVGDEFAEIETIKVNVESAVARCGGHRGSQQGARNAPRSLSIRTHTTKGWLVLVETNRLGCCSCQPTRSKSVFRSHAGPS